MAELTDVESLIELARAYEMAEMHSEMAEVGIHCISTIDETLGY